MGEGHAESFFCVPLLYYDVEQVLVGEELDSLFRDFEFLFEWFFGYFGIKLICKQNMGLQNHRLGGVQHLRCVHRPD